MICLMLVETQMERHCLLVERPRLLPTDVFMDHDRGSSEQAKVVAAVERLVGMPDTLRIYSGYATGCEPSKKPTRNSIGMLRT